MKLSFEGSSFKKKIIHKTKKMYLKDRKDDLSIPLKHLVSPQLFYCDPMVFLQPLTLKTVMQLKALDKHIFVLYWDNSQLRKTRKKGFLLFPYKVLELFLISFMCGYFSSRLELPVLPVSNPV